jgi:thiamine-monophosphate kinase
VSIAIPSDITIEYLESVYAGLKSTAEPHGVNILGGDTSGSKGDLVLNLVLTGVVAEPDVLFRHGARPGDHIYVSGSLGDSAGGLDAIVQQRGDSSEAARTLVQRHLEPRAQVVEGQRIAARRTAHAMLDISDGLAADLGHICAQSGVGCVVEAGKLPISIALCEYCAAHGLDPVALALTGGEDYVLLFCAPGDFAAAGVSAIDIGTIVAEAGCQLVGLRGEICALDTWGWDHLRHTPTPSLS